MVERIRKLCKKQGTSLTKLEQQLGFGNGVIGRWNKSKPSYDRLEKVASALGVTVSDLTGGIHTKEIPASQREELGAEQIWEVLEGLSLSELNDVMAYCAEISRRKLKDDLNN